jgi:hypothetical protein
MGRSDVHTSNREGFETSFCARRPYLLRKPPGRSMINDSGGSVNTLSVVRFNNTRAPGFPFGIGSTSVNSELQPAGRYT